MPLQDGVQARSLRAHPDDQLAGPSPGPCVPPVRGHKPSVLAAPVRVDPVAPVARVVDLDDSSPEPGRVGLLQLGEVLLQRGPVQQVQFGQFASGEHFAIFSLHV